MRLIPGDCLETLKTLPDNSIDSVVTDPPYGLKFMGKKWDYEVPSVEIWREILRVLKPGGHVLSFGGTRTYHRMVVNIEDAGFEIRDQIQWIYGSGFPKSHNGDHGGTALKPANEPICLARKPLIGTVAKNFETHGCGGLNIDASRIEALDADLDQKQNTAKASLSGLWGQDGHSQSKYSPQGRWPANVLFDEVAAEMLDEQSGISKSQVRKISATEDTSIKNQIYGKGYIHQEGGQSDSGGASRFFYVAKASRRERNAGLEGMAKKSIDRYGECGQGATAQQTPRVTREETNHHPTVKPIKLMQYLITLITPPNGVVLDPFMGSGSTGVAAKSLGFKFIGCELSPEYLEIAKKRIEHCEVSA